MADVEVTLNSSGNSVKYKGYVLDSCNNNAHVADGSWSPSSATGMTVSTSGATITITHNNTSTSDASSTFTWTSSKVSGCSKTLKVTVKGKAETYSWYISTNGGSSWSKSSGYSITITVNNNFSGGEFVRVAYCTENRGNCAGSYTVRNGGGFTLSRNWQLSDLKSSGSNCAVFRTDSSLTTDLKNSSNGTYSITGDMISSLGSNFPVSAYYEVSKPTVKYDITVTFVIHVSDNLSYAEHCVMSINRATIRYSFSDTNYSTISGSGSYTYGGNSEFTHTCKITNNDTENATLNINFNVSVTSVVLTTSAYDIYVDGSVSYANCDSSNWCQATSSSIYNFHTTSHAPGDVNRVVSNNTTEHIYISVE